MKTSGKTHDEPDLTPIRISLLSLSLFPALLPLPSFVRPMFGVCSACTCVRESVLEQVRRRLKGRQPGGRRLSKGFRVLPTRTAPVVAAHPRAEAGRIKSGGG